MHRRTFAFSVTVAILLACVLTSGSNVAVADKTNVLFLICDDLNCDIGVYGRPQVKTPNIDKLAKRGVRFEQAHCQYPLCGPSRASFMTGMYPDQTLIHRNAVLIRKHLPDVVTMSQHFKNNGYFATRIGKIYHYNVPADIGNDGHDDPASWTDKFNPKGRDKTEESKVITLRPGKYGGTLSWLAADGTDAEMKRRCEAALADIPDDWDPGRLVGVSGTALAILGIDRGVFALPALLAAHDGGRVGAADLDAMIASWAQMTAAERVREDLIPPLRADALIGGMVLVRTLLARLKRDHFHVTPRGVRHGLLVELQRKTTGSQ